MNMIIPKEFLDKSFFKTQKIKQKKIGKVIKQSSEHLKMGIVSTQKIQNEEILEMKNQRR